MIRAAASYFAGVPLVWIDGTLYLLVALFGYLQTAFGTDEAAKYISPAPLFWIKTGIGALAASVLSLKLFRSTAFAEHQAAKNSVVPSATSTDPTTPTP